MRLVAIWIVSLICFNFYRIPIYIVKASTCEYNTIKTILA